MGDEDEEVGDEEEVEDEEVGEMETEDEDVEDEEVEAEDEDVEKGAHITHQLITVRRVWGVSTIWSQPQLAK